MHVYYKQLFNLFLSKSYSSDNFPNKILVRLEFRAKNGVRNGVLNKNVNTETKLNFLLFVLVRI